MPQKKIPVRHCLGCNEGRPKKELLRIVRGTDGEIKVDLTGKMNGRGAYICPKADCLAKARKAKRLERSLDCEIPPEVYERLAAEVAQAEGSNG